MAAAECLDHHAPGGMADQHRRTLGELEHGLEVVGHAVGPDVAVGRRRGAAMAGKVPDDDVEAAREVGLGVAPDRGIQAPAVREDDRRGVFLAVGFHPQLGAVGRLELPAVAADVEVLLVRLAQQQPHRQPAKQGAGDQHPADPQRRRIVKIAAGGEQGAQLLLADDPVGHQPAPRRQHGDRRQGEAAEQ